MDKRGLNLITRFNRIHNQYALVKKSLIVKNSGLAMYPAEMHLLIAVASSPGCTVSDAAAALSITKSAVSQLLKKLTVKKLLRKVRDTENERVVHLELTDEGRDAVVAFTGREDSLFGEFLKHMDSWPREEIDTVDRFLSALESMFDAKLS